MSFYDIGTPSTNTATWDGRDIPKDMEGVRLATYGRDLAAISASVEAGVKSFNATNSPGMSTQGAMNAIYGSELFSLPYKRAVALGLIGTRAFRTGYRFRRDYSNLQTAGVINGGPLQVPNAPQLNHVEMPYKTLSRSFSMQEGFPQLQTIDDVYTWVQHQAGESEAYMRQLNGDVLRRAEDPKVLGYDLNNNITTQTIGYESLERIISNADEAQYLPDGSVVPWSNNVYIAGTDSSMTPFRSQNAVTNPLYAESNFDSFVYHSYDTGTTTGDATLRPFDIVELQNALMMAMQYGETNENNVRNKVAITGVDTIERIQQDHVINQRFWDTQFANQSVNGQYTFPGRPAGFTVATYMDVPLIPDLDVGRGFGATYAPGDIGPNNLPTVNQYGVPTASKQADAISGLGRVLVADTSHVFRSMLQATMFEVTDQKLIAQSFNKVGLIWEMGEVQANAFRPHAKIIHTQ